MATDDDKRTYILLHFWPGIQVYGKSLQEIFDTHGAAPLLAMLRWPNLDAKWPGVRYWLKTFLELPDIKPLADAAVEEMKKTKSLRARKKKQSAPQAVTMTNAQRARNEQMGFF